MSNYVNETIAENAAKTGTLLGKTEPCREAKGMWWEVYAHGNQVIACAFDALIGVTCGERVTDDRLHLYYDDVEDARKRLEAFRANTAGLTAAPNHSQPQP